MDKNQIEKFIAECENESIAGMRRIDEIALYNQKKVLDAFRQNSVALRHFAGSTGYGYEDAGKSVLSAVFASAFGAEKGIVSPVLASGTHAISTALFGVLRPSDTLLSVTGMPYDTLVPVIEGSGNGSLKEFGIKFEKIELLKDSSFDIKKIQTILSKTKKPKVVWIQRSRGYTWRDSLSIEKIKQITTLVKILSPQTIVMVDNCYGEFTEKLEPTQVGVDVIIGSLIKNPGGGIAPTGGYICGKSIYIDQIANRLTAPGVGVDVGSYADGYRNYFQGFFLAPHTTAQALKGALLFRTAFSKLGYDTLPHKTNIISDIICSIRFNTAEELVKFCQSIQSCAPVDSFAVPEPWAMPGYKDKVIMASGSFVQGSSIELSADAPLREPYIAFVQGGLTYEHIKLALTECLESLDL
ncbi:MAG: methionine gamma-lyase family protein [Firmicutes bacterium]|nr:methionine gamma-lyase family protein [Bacillota bacterium]